MTERQAAQMNYGFTGAYSRDKAEMQQEVRDLKAKGYKAVVCTVPDSPYSRGCIGTGYSVYAERLFFVDKSIAHQNGVISRSDARRAHEKEEYEKELAKIDAQEAEAKRVLDELMKEKDVLTSGQR